MVEEMCVLSGWSPNQTDQVVWELLQTEEEKETVYKLPTFLLLCILMVVGLPGNILVLLVYGFRFPASTTKSFILAMAIFDLINCGIGMPFEMIDLRYDIEFNIPALCKIIRFFITLSACGSVTVLVVVSIDRFRRICRPFQRQMSVKQSQVVIAVLTLFSVLFSVPALILYGQQTEIRYGIVLYDCSIDDVYKTGKFSAAYQYMLGGTWFVCIVILVITYSFIIYKIQLQKQRRDKLSQQSYDSSVFTKLRVVSPESSSNDRPKNVTRSSNEHSSFVKYLKDQSNNVSLGPDHADLRLSVADDDMLEGGRNGQLMRRLFSRDVNPVLEDSQDNCEMDYMDNYDTQDENMSMSDLSSTVRLIKFTSTSLNNYLADSQETGLTKRSNSVVHADINEEVGLHKREEDSPHITRKYGHVFGRFNSWESEDRTHQASVKSSNFNRGLKSHSDRMLAPAEAHVPCNCSETRRAKSLCSLKCAGKDSQDYLPHKSTCLCTRKLCDLFPDDVVKKTHAELKPTTGTTNLSEYLIVSSSVLENNRPRGSSHVNVKWDCPGPDLHQVNKDEQPGSQGNSNGIRTAPANKSQSPNTDITTFLSMKKKRSSVREIKTSKVSLMMLMVTVGFVLSYLPHLGLQVFKSTSQTVVARLLCTSQAYFVIHHFLMRFFFINNAINPIIYSFYNKTFRARCIRLLKSPKSLLQNSEHRINTAPSVSQDNDTS